MIRRLINAHYCGVIQLMRRYIIWLWVVWNRFYCAKTTMKWKWYFFFYFCLVSDVLYVIVQTSRMCWRYYIRPYIRVCFHLLIWLWCLTRVRPTSYYVCRLVPRGYWNMTHFHQKEKFIPISLYILNHIKINFGNMKGDRKMKENFIFLMFLPCILSHPRTQI